MVIVVLIKTNKAYGHNLRMQKYAVKLLVKF